MIFLNIKNIILVINMKCTMKLQPKYFNYMKNGTKRIEIRLYDEKRKELKIGDEIIFQKEPTLNEEIQAIIVDLIIKKSFKDIMQELDVSEYSDKSESEEELLKDLRKYYSNEKEEKYGVVGIKVEIK